MGAADDRGSEQVGEVRRQLAAGSAYRQLGKLVKGSPSRLVRGLVPHAQLLKEAFYALWHHNISRMSAAIAYFGAFSLAPILVIMISLASLVFGRQASEGLVVERLNETLGENTARFIQSMLAGIYESSGLTLATVLAALLLAWAATRIVGAVRGALNDIWGVPGHGGHGFRGYVLGKLIDLGMVVLFGIMFVFSMLASTATSALTRYFADVLPLPGWLLEVLGVLFSLVVTTFFLTIIFRLLPNIRVRLRYIVTGASVTAVLFSLGNFVLGRYLGRLTPASAFGAAGSLAVILIWMYYSAHIILFGAQVTKVYVDRARRAAVARRLAVGEGPSQACELGAGRGPRVAYLILAHKTPEQVARLVSRLGGAAGGDGPLFFIHIDKRTDKATFRRFVSLLASWPGVRFVRRHRSRWGEFGIVRASLEAIKEALAARPPVDYLVLLTGQDYPIKSAAYIEAFFRRSGGRSYIDLNPVPCAAWPQAERRMRSWYARIWGEQVLLPRRQSLRAVLRRPRRWPVYVISRLLPAERPPLKGYEPFTGSAYWVLSRAAAEYVLNFTREHPSFVKFFKRVFCPDELFFHTILAGSPSGIDLVANGLHYIDWSRGGAHPAIITKDHLPELRGSPALFARKFDPEVDAEVLDLIDRELLGLGGPT